MFSKNLKVAVDNHCALNGCTFQSFAELLGVNRVTLARWCANNSARPSAPNLSKICVVLGITEADLHQPEVTYKEGYTGLNKQYLDSSPDQRMHIMGRVAVAIQVELELLGTGSLLERKSGGFYHLSLTKPYFGTHILVEGELVHGIKVTVCGQRMDDWSGFCDDNIIQQITNLL